MKKIIILFSLLIFSFSFTFQKQQAQIINQQTKLLGPILNDQIDQNNLRTCSSIQINTIFNAISSCQVQSINNTANCLMSSITLKLNQNWNVFIQSSSDSDSAAFWFFSDCYISLNNYGKYSRSYILWPATNQKTTSPIQIYKNKQMKGQQTCLEWRVNTVKSIISQNCDIAENSNSSDCIINKIKQKMNENWNSYVGLQNSTLQGWYFDACEVQLIGFGKFKRNFYVWKANPST